MSGPLKHDHHVGESRHDVQRDDNSTEVGVVKDQQTFAYSESRKIGVTGAVFLILNKMIGTGSESHSSIRLHTKLIDALQSSQPHPASSNRRDLWV